MASSKKAPKKASPSKTSAKKAAAKKAAKKPAAKKPAAKKPAAKKSAAKKPAAKKSAAKPVKKAVKAQKPAAKKSAAKKPAAKKTSAKKVTASRAKTNARHGAQPAELFSPLTEGERAESLRLLLEDNRLANMAKVGRYRVIAIEPLALKSPDPLASSRIARVVIYDYSSDRCVVANVDLDNYAIHHLSINRSQPMLAAEEEMAAMEIAVLDDRVHSQLSLGEGPQAAMHYWSQRSSDLSHSRRSAAVLFGEPGARPSLVAVVDLLDARVTEVVSAELW